MSVEMTFADVKNVHCLYFDYWYDLLSRKALSVILLIQISLALPKPEPEERRAPFEDTEKSKVSFHCDINGGVVCWFHMSTVCLVKKMC